MTDTQTPEDWVLIEAAKRSEYGVNNVTLMYKAGGAFRALCDMIAKHEQKPVDRKLLCAWEAMLLDACTVDICIRAIELYLEGFGE
jgi:hypothetical protein